MSWITDLFNQTVKGDKATPFFTPLSAMSSILWGSNEYVKNFLEVPEINAVVTIKARAMSNMMVTIVNKKTGDPIPMTDKLAQLAIQPNYFQSFKDFIFQSALFYNIYGNVYVYPFKPVGQPNNMNSLFSIPPNAVTVVYPYSSGAFYMAQLTEFVKYQINWSGDNRTLKANEIIHISAGNPNPIATDWLEGKSPMISLSMPIQNIRASYEARNVLIENRGALGILSNSGTDITGGAVPMEAKEKQQLQDALKGYGMSKKQAQFIITNLNLKWQQMTIDADKLQLHEENRESLTRICDVYGVPFELLGNQKGVTFANKLTAEKAMYQDTIIPEAQIFINALNRYFEKNNIGYELRASFDHIAVFDEDNVQKQAKNTMWQDRYKANLITLNQYYAGVGLPQVENGDRYAKDDEDMPLVSIIGVSGTQALQSVIADPSIPRENKVNILIFVFGIKPEQAQLMV